MVEERLEKIYHQMEELQEKKYKEQYDRLLDFDKSIGSFEDYLKREKEIYDNVEVKQDKLADAFLERDSIRKDNISIDLYLIHYNHVDSVQLDENYRPLPLNEREIFEYGSVITFNVNDGKCNINGLFSGIEKDKINAMIKYNDLKEKMYTLSENEILDIIEKDIQK